MEWFFWITYCVCFLAYLVYGAFLSKGKGNMTKKDWAGVLAVFTFLLAALVAGFLILLSRIDKVDDKLNDTNTGLGTKATRSDIEKLRGEIEDKVDKRHKEVGDKIDKVLEEIKGLDASIRGEIGGKDGIRERLARVDENVKILMAWYNRQVARETAFDTMYAKATIEEQQKLWKVKPFFDSEYARLLKEFGNPDDVEKELPALKVRLLNLDFNGDEKESPNGQEKRGTPKIPVEKLPLPPK